MFNFCHSLKKNQINEEFMFLNIITTVFDAIKEKLLCKNNIDVAFTFAKLGVRFISIFELLKKSQKYLLLLQKILSEYGYTKKWCFTMIDRIEEFEFLFDIIEPSMSNIIRDKDFINMEIVKQFLYYSTDNYMDYIDDWTNLSNKVVSFVIKEEN